ncbi:hypothetical protein FACS18949_04410 [Clostridia bacterium]|nr:hypothetical protein FACS189425_06490 [Clostridia bacterium]GHV32695.1 hypothetical protein FACS18949_04410 [Clostridia bacterium]
MKHQDLSPDDPNEIEIIHKGFITHFPTISRKIYKKSTDVIRVRQEKDGTKTLRFMAEGVGITVIIDGKDDTDNV